jgi:type IV secretory pathway VirJ component
MRRGGLPTTGVPRTVCAAFAQVDPNAMKWLLPVVCALLCGLSVVAAAPAAPKPAAPAHPVAPAHAPGIVPRTMEFPPMGTLTVYVPPVVNEDTDLVLFASGDGEWNQGVIDMAEPIAALGKIVVGFSTPEYLKRIDASKQKCAYPPQELEALSQFVQRELGIKHYRAPLLVGYSSGATLVYVALAQAPINAFMGGIDLGFCPDIVMKKPLCRQGALMEPLKAHKNMDPNAGTNTNVFALYPVKHFAAPLHVMQGSIDEVCTIKDVEPFITSADNATLTTVDKVGHGFAVQDHWFSKFVDADKTIDAQYSDDDPPDDPVVADLPLVELPVTGSQSTFFVMFSGDGGWSTLTQKVAAELNADGNPVVGWNTLKYFWSAKTPTASAADLGRVIEHFAQTWHKHGVVLVGYSMGADVLPAIVNRLPAASRQRVRSVVLLAPVRAASFEFHLTGWLNRQARDAVPIKPEVDALAPIPLTCIYGTEEAATSLCTQISGANITIKALPGAHHFDRDYKELAQLVLNTPNT